MFNQVEEKIMPGVCTAEYYYLLFYPWKYFEQLLAQFAHLGGLFVHIGFSELGEVFVLLPRGRE